MGAEVCEGQGRLPTHTPWKILQVGQVGPRLQEMVAGPTSTRLPQADPREDSILMTI